MKMTMMTMTKMKTTRAFCSSFSSSSSSSFHPPFPLLPSPASPAVSPSTPHHQILPRLCQAPKDALHWQLPRRFFFHAGILLLLTEARRTCAEGPWNKWRLICFRSGSTSSSSTLQRERSWTACGRQVRRCKQRLVNTMQSEAAGPNRTRRRTNTTIIPHL